MTGKPKSAVGRTAAQKQTLVRRKPSLKDASRPRNGERSAAQPYGRRQSGQGRSSAEGENSVQIVRTPSAREICPGLFLWRWFALEGADRSRYPVPVRIDMKKPRRNLIRDSPKGLARGLGHAPDLLDNNVVRLLRQHVAKHVETLFDVGWVGYKSVQGD